MRTRKKKDKKTEMRIYGEDMETNSRKKRKEISDRQFFFSFVFNGKLKDGKDRVTKDQMRAGERGEGGGIRLIYSNRLKD